ncbi:MAG: ribonuclease T [Cellvibrionales bacterium]|jgi:ribonuclease T
MSEQVIPLIKDRFRGFLPVVVDVETGGFNAATDALLEVAATLVVLQPNGSLEPGETLSFNVDPFEGSNIEASALEFTGIDPENPLRDALPEAIALGEVFSRVRREVRDTGCSRAILVGHNAHFDAGFINAATSRCDLKRNPFHPFSYFDTATLSGLAYGHTVLAQACKRADIEFSNSDAHSAAYDAQKTAELFCRIVNQWQRLGGWQWPVPAADPE